MAFKSRFKAPENGRFQASIMGWGAKDLLVIDFWASLNR